MADVVVDKGGSGGGNTMLAFIVGAVLVAVGVIGFFMYNGSHGGGAAPKPAASISVDVNKR